MSIHTTSAARSRSFVQRRNAYVHMRPQHQPRTPPSSTPSRPDAERSDGRGTAPTPHTYERRYDISLGYEDGRNIIIR